MEDQAISMIMRGGEMMLRLTKDGIRMMMQAVALIKAMINRQIHSGQVPVDWLTKQYDTAAFTIPQKQMDDFRSEAGKINMLFSVVESRDPEGVKIVVRQTDIPNFNNIIDEIGVVENDVKKESVGENEKDIGIITKADEGKGYYSFILPAADSVKFQNVADEKSLIYATPQDVGAPIDYLKKNEMLSESYNALVERNKDNSPESGLVHSSFWPKLREQGNLETVVLSENQYEEFKAALSGRGEMGKTLFAVAAKDGDLILAYRTEKRGMIQDITGKTDFKIMVEHAELENRMEQAADKGDHSFVIIEDQQEQARELMQKVGIVVPEMKRMANGEKYFENLEHRADRVLKEHNYTSAKEMEMGSMENNEQEYCLFGLYDSEATEFKQQAEAQGIVYIEEQSSGFSQFVIAQEQKGDTLEVLKQAGTDLRSLHIEDAGVGSMYIQNHWKMAHGAEMSKLDRKRMEIRQGMKEQHNAVSEMNKVSTDIGKDIGGAER